MTPIPVSWSDLKNDRPEASRRKECINISLQDPPTITSNIKLLSVLQGYLNMPVCSRTPLFPRTLSQQVQARGGLGGQPNRFLPVSTKTVALGSRRKIENNFSLPSRACSQLDLHARYEVAAGGGWWRYTGGI